VTPAGTYRRALRLPRAEGVVALTPGDGAVRAELRLQDLRDLPAAVERSRRVLDLDTDPVAVDAHLATDPFLAAAVTARPGLRVPGSPDPEELAIRAVLGQQVGVTTARTFAARLVADLGAPLAAPWAAVRRRFPTAAALAEADLRRLGVPRARQACLRRLAEALAGGEVVLDAGVDRAAARAALDRVPGVGPWTVEVVALRGLHDPDAFPARDLVLRRSAAALGVAPARLGQHAERWRPWRAYAAQHLWSLDRPAADAA
jgi:AraC family transcriptional regulator, regulatory protein of adaptative response / DNA-3-methyladenine glycosylase II